MTLIHKQMHIYMCLVHIILNHGNIELNAEHNLYELSKDVWINSVIDFMFLGCV